MMIIRDITFNNNTMKNQNLRLMGVAVLLIGLSLTAKAQITSQKIGENPTVKTEGAVLELESANKGLLFPRVALSSTTAWGLAGTATRGMLVYNTNTTTDGFTGSTAYPVAAGDGTGLYFWDGTGWAAAARVSASGADLTKDAWVDDAANTQVKLGKQSDGSADRPAGTEFVAKDNGNVGIGLSNPAGILDIKGKMYVSNKQTIYNADALTQGMVYNPFTDTSSPLFAGSLFIGDGGQNLTNVSPARTGRDNTAVGIGAMLANTGGVSNTALGSNALKANTAGSNNTAIGSGTLQGITVYAHNTAVGYFALNKNNANENVAVGSYALQNNTSGSQNTAMGANALSNLSTGSFNTGFGTFVLSGLTTGSNNTAVGYNIGGISTGSNNTIIGAQISGLPSDLSNNIILADGQGNQRIRVINNGKTVIGDGSTITPTALLDVAPSAASASALRLRNLSDSQGKQNTEINYSDGVANLMVDKNGNVYKQYNPVTASTPTTAATNFDGSYTVQGPSGTPIATPTTVNDGSIIRFTLYTGFALGQGGIGANLYAEITYGNTTGFRVVTYASDAGGTATNGLTIMGEGTKTLTFDFATGTDLVISSTATTTTGEIQMKHTASGTVEVRIFNSFKSR
jgi:hypothetical protein